jgi:hypothetical protein
VEALAGTRISILERSIGFCVCSLASGFLLKASRAASTARKRPNLLKPAYPVRARRAGVLAIVGELLYSVSTGKSAFDHVFGMPIFHYWSANSERAHIFDNAMASRSAAETAAVLAVYDFSDAKHVTDIRRRERRIARRYPRGLPATRRQTVRLTFRYRARSHCSALDSTARHG